MKEFWNVIQMVFTAVGGWLGYFLGGNDGLLIALVVFAVADYITGVMCAVSDKKLNSQVPEGTDFPAGGDCPHSGCAGHRYGFRASHGGDFLLSVQRGCEYHRERRTPWTAHPGKAEGGIGAAP